MAMCRLRWHPEGRFVAVGDASGHVVLYQVGADIATPRADEFARLARVVGDWRAESAASVSGTNVQRTRDDPSTSSAMLVGSSAN